MPLAAVLIPGGVALADDSPLLSVVASAGVALLLTGFWLLSGNLAEQRRLAAELTALSRQFEHQSLHDPLTGLANRSLFSEQLSSAWAAHQRHGRGLALLMVDLGGFKTVNDQYGHHAGDHLLAEIARRLHRCMRARDTLARLGGDEFALVVPEADLDEAHTLADRIQEQLAAPVMIDGRPASRGRSQHRHRSARFTSVVPSHAAAGSGDRPVRCESRGQGTNRDLTSQPRASA